MVFFAPVHSQQLFDKDPLYEPASEMYRYNLSGGKWNKLELTYYIENTSKHLTPEVRERSITKALASWHSVTNITFTKVSDRSKADLVFEWLTGNHGDGKKNKFDGKGGVLAHAGLPETSNAGEIHFDDDDDWDELFYVP